MNRLQAITRMRVFPRPSSSLFILSRSTIRLFSQTLTSLQKPEESENEWNFPPNAEIKKEMHAYSEKDIEQMEKALEQFIEEEEKAVKPVQIANIFLVALSLLFAILYQRSLMSLDTTKELLIDTEDELGREIDRLRGSRSKIVETLLKSGECDEKCKKLVQRISEEMVQEDSLNAKMVKEGIKKIEQQPILPEPKGKSK